MNKNKLLQSHSSSNALITSLLTALFERSDETEQHAKRMQEMSERLGKHLHFSSSQINDLKLLALLHDIGKMGIDDAILKKPNKLTPFNMNNCESNQISEDSIIKNNPLCCTLIICGINKQIQCVM